MPTKPGEIDFTVNFNVTQAGAIDLYKGKSVKQKKRIEVPVTGKEHLVADVTVKIRYVKS